MEVGEMENIVITQAHLVGFALGVPVGFLLLMFILMMAWIDAHDPP